MRHAAKLTIANDAIQPATGRIRPSGRSVDCPNVAIPQTTAQPAQNATTKHEHDQFGEGISSHARVSAFSRWPLIRGVTDRRADPN